MSKLFAWLGRVITALCANFADLLAGLSLFVVSAATGFISYTHISALTEDYWQNWKTAHLMPLAVDGQIVIGSLYWMRHSGEKRRWLGLIGVAPGILESLYSNWASVAPPPGTPWLVSWEAHIWATVPAQAFACSTILFERWLHSRRENTPAAAPVTAPLLTPVPAPAVTPALPLVHVHPAPQEAPWGLVTPAAPPAPATAPVPSWMSQFPVLPVAGPHQPLNGHAKRSRSAAQPDGRLPLPQDPDELRVLVTSVSRNALFSTYQVSKHGADKLRAQFGVGQQESEEVASRAA